MEVQQFMAVGATFGPLPWDDSACSEDDATADSQSSCVPGMTGGAPCNIQVCGAHVEFTSYRSESVMAAHMCRVAGGGSAAGRVLAAQ